MVLDRYLLWEKLMGRSLRTHFTLGMLGMAATFAGLAEFWFLVHGAPVSSLCLYAGFYGATYVGFVRFTGCIGVCAFFFLGPGIFAIYKVGWATIAVRKIADEASGHTQERLLLDAGCIRRKLDDYLLQCCHGQILKMTSVCTRAFMGGNGM